MQLKPKSIRVLALDPGYDRLGVAVLERQEGKEVLLFSTCIETNRNDALVERLFHIGSAVETLIKDHQPDAVAIETLFFNANIKTAIGVAQHNVDRASTLQRVFNADSNADASEKIINVPLRTYYRGFELTRC